MSYLRTTLDPQPARLVVAVVVVLAVGGAAIAVAAGGGGPTPPPKPLDQAIHDALAAPRPDGVTARVKFTNNLFPSGALARPGRLGADVRRVGPAVADERRPRPHRAPVRRRRRPDRLERRRRSRVYDASSNTVYRADLPASTTAGAHDRRDARRRSPRSTSFLAELGDATGRLRRAARPTSPASPPTASAASPKHDGGLLGSVELAWDAAQGVPLRRGSTRRAASRRRSSSRSRTSRTAPSPRATSTSRRPPARRSSTSAPARRREQRHGHAGRDRARRGPGRRRLPGRRAGLARRPAAPRRPARRRRHRARRSTAQGLGGIVAGRAQGRRRPARGSAALGPADRLARRR